MGSTEGLSLSRERGQSRDSAEFHADQMRRMHTALLLFRETMIADRYLEDSYPANQGKLILQAALHNICAAELRFHKPSHPLQRLVNYQGVDDMTGQLINRGLLLNIQELPTNGFAITGTDLARPYMLYGDDFNLLFDVRLLPQAVIDADALEAAQQFYAGIYDNTGMVEISRPDIDDAPVQNFSFPLRGIQVQSLQAERLAFRNHRLRISRRVSPHLTTNEIWAQGPKVHIDNEPWAFMMRLPEAQ